jgi:cytochrome P450
MKFALHVISGAGFGVPFTWEKSSDDVWPQHTMSFRDAVHTLLTHLLAIVLLPKRILQLPLPWKELRRSGQAYTEFGGYMHDLLEREKSLGKDSDGLNLMSALVKHSTSEDSAAELGVLQDDEIIGNTFIFLLAGHETTYRSLNHVDRRANTLMYAFTMLALHPQVQDTLVSEILQVCDDRVPTYEDFPNLVYPLCVMFETLRHFPPVVGIPKCTVNGEQTLLGKYYIPKNATVMYDVINLHHNPKYWGNDVDSFNPSRFDGRNLTEKAVEKDIGDDAPGAKLDRIKMPPRGAFVPFSEGARSCLGN